MHHQETWAKSSQPAGFVGMRQLQSKSKQNLKILAALILPF